MNFGARLAAAITFLITIGGPIYHAQAANKPLILSSTDGKCEAILRSDDFLELEGANNLKFDWSGECRNGYVHGAGRFKIFSGDFIVALQDFGPNKGVDFDNGVIHFSDFGFTQYTSRRTLTAGPGLLACPLNNIQRDGITFLDGVNLDSQRFLIEFTEYLEGRVNEICRPVAGQNGKLDVLLHSTDGKIDNNCNISGTCVYKNMYRVKARIEFNVSSSGYIDLTFEGVRAANGGPITSRYEEKIFQLNLPARRLQSQQEMREKNSSVRSDERSRKDEVEDERAAERRALIKAARQPQQSSERKNHAEMKSSYESEVVDSIPLPTEYEIVHEVGAGDFRSSGEFSTLSQCEAERAKSFPDRNARCMQFIEAREKISPN